MRAWADDGRASLVEILTPNGSRSGGVALLRPSRSALRRSKLGHGRGQAIGARMHGSAPWKTEETIVGLPRLLVLSVFSRFGGCHLSPTFHLFKGKNGSPDQATDDRRRTSGPHACPSES